MASPKPRPVGSTSPDPSNYHDPDPTQHSRSQQFSTSAPKSDRDEEKDEEVVQKPASPAAAPLSPVAASVSLAPTKKKSPDPTLSPPLRSGLLTQLCAASDGEEKEEEEERDAAIKVGDGPLVSLHCAFVPFIHAVPSRRRPQISSSSERSGHIAGEDELPAVPHPLELLHGPFVR
jgi:hypothetical protein